MSGSMEDMRYNEAGKLDKAKTSHVPGQNPWPDMQVLPYVLVRPYKNAPKGHRLAK